MRVVLVLAEDSAVREALRASLDAQDVVLLESRVHDAARRLMSLRVDAILLDDAPQLGLAALESLHTAAPLTPVVVLAGRGDVITQAAFIRAGADDVVAKPFDCGRLREVLARVIARPATAIAAAAPEPAAPAGALAGGRHQIALRWLSRTVLYSEDRANLSPRLVEASVDIFDAMRCAVLLEEDGALRVAASLGLPESLRDTLRLPASGGLMRCFDRSASLLDRETVAQDPEASKELLLLNGWMAAPLLKDGQVAGIIVLGEKANGQSYSLEERELLTLIARAGSLAFERAGNHARLTEHQQHLDKLFTHLNAGVVAVDSEKRVVAINPRAAGLLGVERQQLLGQSVQRLGSAIADVLLRALVDGQTQSRDIELADSGKRVQVHAQPLGAEGAVAEFTEIAGERVATEDIAYSPFWEYLSSRVAQEIKNPMVAINTFAQLLPRKYDSVDFRDAFSEVVQQEVQRINRVVETLYEFARNPQLTLQRCSVNETVEQVLRTFDDELAARSIDLDAALDPAVLEAELDPVYFSQALHNVVQNSIDAMPGGGHLSVRTVRQANGVEIRVSDTGPGVAEKDAAMIFMPFYSTREKGMGLGLPLAERIVRQHNGELTLLREEDGSSSFAIHVPASRHGHADDSRD